MNLTRLLRTILRTAGLDVLSADEGREAIDVASREPVDLIILDLRMPGMDGREVFHELRARGVAAPVLIASAYGARSAQVELGAEAWIEKPFDPDMLLDTVTRLLAAGNGA